MNVSRTEAEQALKDIDAIESRARRMGNYRDAAPYFFIWGVVIGLGNIAMEFIGSQAAAVWGGIGLIAVVLTIIIGRRQSAARRATSDISTRDWQVDDLRIGLSFSVITGFLITAGLLLYPLDIRQINTLLSLFWAYIYLMMGIWMGWRIALVGLTMILLLLAGFYFLDQYYFLWNGLTVGSSFILGGLWLRKV